MGVDPYWKAGKVVGLGLRVGVPVRVGVAESVVDDAPDRDVETWVDDVFGTFSRSWHF